MIQPWPPLITDATRPHWTIWRDRLLTVLLWLILIGLFIEQSVVLWRRIDKVFFPAEPTPLVVWEFRLLPFLAVAAILIIRLSIWDFISKRRLDRVTREPPPPPLALEVEAKPSGLSVGALMAAREHRVAVVEIDNSGRYIVTPKRQAATVTAARSEAAEPV